MNHFKYTKGHNVNLKTGEKKIKGAHSGEGR